MALELQLLGLRVLLPPAFGPDSWDGHIKITRQLFYFIREQQKEWEIPFFLLFLLGENNMKTAPSSDPHPAAWERAGWTTWGEGREEKGPGSSTERLPSVRGIWIMRTDRQRSLSSTAFPHWNFHEFSLQTFLGTALPCTTLDKQCTPTRLRISWEWE